MISHEIVLVRVKVTDVDDEETEWSETIKVEAGLIGPDAWSGVQLVQAMPGVCMHRSQHNVLQFLSKYVSRTCPFEACYISFDSVLLDNAGSFFHFQSRNSGMIIDSTCIDRSGYIHTSGPIHSIFREQKEYRESSPTHHRSRTV